MLDFVQIHITPYKGQFYEFNKYYIEKMEKICKENPISTDEVIKRDFFVGKKVVAFKPISNEELTEHIKEFGIKLHLRIQCQQMF